MKEVQSRGCYHVLICAGWFRGLYLLVHRVLWTVAEETDALRIYRASEHQRPPHDVCPPEQTMDDGLMRSLTTASTPSCEVHEDVGEPRYRRCGSLNEDNREVEHT